MEIVPAIDIQDGGCVRLNQGRFDEVIRYPIEPQRLARQYSKLGVRRLHVVDLDGAGCGSRVNLRTIQRIVSSTTLSVQLGGGIRDVSLIASLLDTGIERVVIGSLAVTDPKSTLDALHHFGPERIVLAFDVRIDSSGVPRLQTHGWKRSSRLSLGKAIERYRQAGLRHIVCTDVSRDGALQGPNETLYRTCVTEYGGILFQAAGGVRHMEDLCRLNDTGVHAAIIGRALLEKRISPKEIEQFLQSA